MTTSTAPPAPHNRPSPHSSPAPHGRLGPAPARWLALCLMSTASTGASLLLPTALGRTLDLLLTREPATRWVLSCAALVLLLALLDAAETVLGGTVTART